MASAHLTQMTDNQDTVGIKTQKSKPPVFGLFGFHNFTNFAHYFN